MRILIDSDLIGRNRSGNETYLRGLLTGLMDLCRGDQFILAGGVPEEIATLGDPASFDFIPIRHGLIGEYELSSAIRKVNPEVILAHYNAPLSRRGFIATVIHDASFMAVPETFPRLLRTRLLWSTRRSISRSAMIVTVSEFSKRELVRYFPSLSPDRVVVTYNAPDRRLFTRLPTEVLHRTLKKFSLRNEFVFTVGNLQPRKNLVRLSHACDQAGVQLMIAGAPAWNATEVTGHLAPSATLLGRVTFPELHALMQTCAVFAYPSLYEGYGLPVIEAMAAGAPVVTSNTTALREIAHDAALLVDPTSTTAIRDGIVAAATDRKVRDALVSRGCERAAEFDWRRSAEALRIALEKALERP